MALKESCYHIVMHFRSYDEARAIMDAQQSQLDDERMWKIELRVVRE